jgi:hypothetical protein
LSLQGSLSTPVQGDFVPAFAGLEGKVLRFEAFTSEQVPENLTQPSRVRKFTICYHLVDDSIQVKTAKAIVLISLCCSDERTDSCIYDVRSMNIVNKTAVMLRVSS